MNEISAFLATWMDLEIIMLREVSHTMRHQHQMLSLICGIWRKGQNELLCRTDTDSQTLKNLWFPKEIGGWGDVLGLWGGNFIKLDCDDHCTTINVINALSNKKIKIKQSHTQIFKKTFHVLF